VELFCANMIGNLFAAPAVADQGEIRYLPSPFFPTLLSSRSILQRSRILVQNITLASLNDDRRVDLHAPSLAPISRSSYPRAPYKQIRRRIDNTS
jgi:hypothetical protein